MALTTNEASYIAVLCIVISVLPISSLGKEFGPVLLLTVAEGSEVVFHGLVLPHRLAVSLQVEGSQLSVVNAHV